MKSILISQPEIRLGEILRQYLNPSYEWEEFRAAVAFVRKSGLVDIEEELEKFIVSSRVIFSVGIDLEQTSIEALGFLMEKVVSKGGNVWVFHNEYNNPKPTFHPKIYLFRKQESAVVIIGSGNLTKSGLFVNYEANLLLDLDLKVPEEFELYESVTYALDRWCDPDSGLAQQLSPELIEKLTKESYIFPEKLIKEEIIEHRQKKSKAKTERIFGSVQTFSSTKRKIKRKVVQPLVPSIAGLLQGELLWSKILTTTDAQRQTGHPVGGVRLTQADNRNENNELIDPQTYFRRKLFGHLGWITTASKQPFVEETQAVFHVKVLGTDYGIRELKISDKPSGEANQGNYTSTLHWGALMEVIRKTDIAGKRINIFAPPIGRSAPYTLEIIEP